MLIAIGIFLFTLFGGVSGVHERIEDHVQDATRREAALEVLAGIEELQADLNEQITETSRAFRVVHRNYEATREDYIAAVEPLRETRVDVGTRLRQSWLDMREILTDEEWTAVFPRREE